MRERGIAVQVFPLPEGGIPEQSAFRKLLDGLIRRLLAGSSVVVASRHGRGRTGLTVACLVRDIGAHDANFAIEWIGFYRENVLDVSEAAALRARLDLAPPCGRSKGIDPAPKGEGH